MLTAAPATVPSMAANWTRAMRENWRIVAVVETDLKTSVSVSFYTQKRGSCEVFRAPSSAMSIVQPYEFIREGELPRAPS